MKNEVDNIRAWVKALMVTGLLLLASCTLVHAEEWTDDQIVSAIGKAECGPQMNKCTYWYGIRSVHYENKEEAKKICKNTIRNNRKRYSQQGIYKDYLSFLASKYCPLIADNDKRRINKNWLRNVLFYLNKKG